MPAIITSKFRRNNAQQFEESFGEASPNIYYLGIGKPTAFGTKTRAASGTAHGCCRETRHGILRKQFCQACRRSC